MLEEEPEEFDQQATVATAAHCATARVGDGCLIWRFDPGADQFVLLAADHRDPNGRGRFGELVGTRLDAAAGTWLQQARSGGVAVRPPGPDAGTLRGCGLPERGRIGDLILVPAPASDLVLVAIRDRISARLSDRDRVALRRIAIRLDAESRASDRPEPEGGVDLAEQSGAAVWATDASGVTMKVNRAACELVGIPAVQLVGVPFAEFVGTERVRAASATGIEREGVLLCAGGASRRIAITTRAVLDQRGEAAGSVHTVIDITDRHETEVALRTRLDQETATRRFAGFLLERPSAEQAARRAVEILAEQFGAPLIVLSHLSPQGRSAVPLATAGRLAAEHPAAWEGEIEIPAGSPARIAAESGEPIRVADFGGRLGYQPGPISEWMGARSVACVPIAGGEGCISVLRQETNAITDGELAMLEAVAALLDRCWDGLPAAV